MNDRVMPAMAVRTHGLVKRYGRETALAGIDLAVPEGGVYLLAGTNGAGKSTLLRTLMNIERPDEGGASVMGHDTQAEGPKVRALTGYVPETGEGGYRWLTAGQFLSHVARFSRDWDVGYANELAGQLDVGLNKPMGNLSKGQARRVQIVAALAHRPRLLLLDELTDGLDPLVRESLLSLLAAHLADTGATAILSTHLVGESEALIDHIGVLRAGRLVAQAPVEAVLAKLHRYHLDAPAGWSPPGGIAAAVLRREVAIGKSGRLIMAGDPAELTQRLQQSGAGVRETTRLGLTEAVPVLLASEKHHDFA